DPTSDPTATLIERVERIDATIESYAGGAVSARSRGGMRTKLQAAKLATAGGVDVVIANGHQPNVLERLIAGEPAGTLFIASTDRLEGRKRWMLSGMSARDRKSTRLNSSHANIS